MIELNELYKTVYFKKFLNPFFTIKFSKNCLKKSHFLFFLYRKKIVDFSRSSAIFHQYYHVSDLKISSFDAAWKTASNDIDFKVSAYDIYRELFVLRRRVTSKSGLDHTKKASTLDRIILCPAILCHFIRHMMEKKSMYPFEKIFYCCWENPFFLYQ